MASGTRTAGVRLGSLALLLLLVLATAPALAAVTYPEPPEDYSSYQPQKKCRSRPQPGTVALARWIDRKFDGGDAAASIRRCRSGGTSEHKDGRAIDWAMNAGRLAHRREVRRFLGRLFATDAQGHHDALARRLGIMYVIWNDRMYASYRDQFAPTAYTPCRPVRSCSKTARHRDHVHISLSRPGGAATTSWYVARGIGQG